LKFPGSHLPGPSFTFLIVNVPDPKQIPTISPHFTLNEVGLAGSAKNSLNITNFFSGKFRILAKFKKTKIMSKEDLMAIETIVEKAVKPVRDDLATVKDDLAALKKDVGSMKEDVQLLAALNQLEAIRKDRRLMSNLRQAV
jgi:hypothetical protein